MIVVNKFEKNGNIFKFHKNILNKYIFTLNYKLFMYFDIII